MVGAVVVVVGPVVVVVVVGGAVVLVVVDAGGVVVDVVDEVDVEVVEVGGDVVEVVVVAGTDVDVVVPVGTVVDVVAGATVVVVVVVGSSGVEAGVVGGDVGGLVGGVVTVPRAAVVGGGVGNVMRCVGGISSGPFDSFDGSGVVVLVVDVVDDVDVVEVVEDVLDEVDVSSVDGTLTGGAITTGAEPPGPAPVPGPVAVAAGAASRGPSSALLATYTTVAVTAAAAASRPTTTGIGGGCGKRKRGFGTNAAIAAAPAPTPAATRARMAVGTTMVFTAASAANTWGAPSTRALMAAASAADGVTPATAWPSIPATSCSNGDRSNGNPLTGAPSREPTDDECSASRSTSERKDRHAGSLARRLARSCPVLVHHRPHALQAHRDLRLRGPRRNAHRRRDLVVRQVLEVAQHHRRAVLRRQLLEQLERRGGAGDRRVVAAGAPPVTRPARRAWPSRRSPSTCCTSTWRANGKKFSTLPCFHCSNTRRNVSVTASSASAVSPWHSSRATR